MITPGNWTGDAHTINQLFDASPIPMVVLSFSRDALLAINQRAAVVLNVTPRDVIGTRVIGTYVDPGEHADVIEKLRHRGSADDVPLRLHRADGQPVWTVTSARRVSWDGEQAMLFAFADISRQRAAEQALATSERRLAAQSSTLTALTERSAEGATTGGDRLKAILSMAAETLDAERMSVWRFSDDRQAIMCEGLFSRASDRYEVGARIPRTLYPPYFEALESDRVIAAHDAQRDPRTSGFTETYLAPNGIGAMLDVPVRHNRGTHGVLCTEHVGGPRVWTLDEQNFALSVANLIAVAVTEGELRTALGRVAESEARANLIVDTAHDAFVGIDAHGQIVNWNAQAASTFGWTRSEVLGRNLVETIIPPNFRKAHLEGLRRFHATGEAPVLNRRLELKGLHRSGREFPIELTITSPVSTKDGVFFGAFLRDISERKEHDDQLRSAKEGAERSRDGLSRELASAARMQRLLLPTTLPTHATVRFGAYYRTSRHAGGDYYDVLRVGPEHFALVVADVSGHGASAAIVMAMIRAVVHSCNIPQEFPDNPVALLNHLNRHFRYLWSTQMYATAVVAVLNAKTRMMRIASAGHPPPLLVRGGKVSDIRVDNAPLLFWEELGDVPVLDVQLQPCDRVVFYTDGITDRPASDETRFDMPRLEQTLARAAPLQLDAMIDHLVQALDTFAGDHEADDDQTVFAVEIQ